MPIAGAVVIARHREDQQHLSALLGAESSLEVSGIGPAGIAIILETETMDEMIRLTQKVKQRADVADLHITYCNWEDQD